MSVLSPEERQEIINAACEKALLMLPEVIGNLITSRSLMLKMTSEFYKSFPEFKPHKDAVASVVEKYEMTHPGTAYEDILKNVIPDIRARIKTTLDMDVNMISKTPDRHLPELSLTAERPHGVL